jgi:tetratricopeptide (TPR) repeat protein
VTETDFTQRDEPDEALDDATKREGPGMRRAQVATRDVDIASAPDLFEPERLARGTALGRYIVIDVLGEGGMGVVYSAYDPELDRKVAIKLLQAGPEDGRGSSSSGSTDQQWLTREAQAMARLSHPNVIAVHDVGQLPGRRVFVAMEQVDGVTLRIWLRDKVRPWREVLEVMVAAGHGLAAAHKGGLVHRDFKPDNVLVGNDGRVRVMDFGLARLRPGETGVPDRQSDPAIVDVEARSPLSAPLTEAGTVIGTPAYMAPEIGDGVLADARSDQFSFGVALYEAVYRARPFGKGEPRTKPKPPPDSKVPERVQRVVMRAIHADPALRFTSMDELLAELTRASAPRRTPVIAGLAVIGLGAAAVTGFAASKTSEAPQVETQLCKGAERRLAGVWDASSRAAVTKAFAASGRPFQAKAAEAVGKALDGYATKWTAAATEACEATRLRGEQTEEVLSLRQACLDQRLYELRALVVILGTADDKMVEAGDKLVFQLDPLERCANVAALRAPGLPPLEPRDKVEELRQLLASSKAELIAGRHFGSMEAARKAAILAGEVKYEPYRAEALLVRGTSLAGIGNTTEATTVFADAVWAALASNRHDLVTMGAMSNAAVVVEGRVGESTIWLGLARTSAVRLGSDAQLEQRLLQVEGLVAATRGDLQEALASQQKALAIAERTLGADNPALWSDVEVIGVTLAKSGAWEKAIGPLERAMALRQSAVGDDHPDLAAILTNLGAAYSSTNQADKARAAYEKALSIRERADGPRNPMLILTLNNMADAMTKAKDHQNALHYVERGRLLALEVLGKAAPMYHAIATTHAEALAAAGRTTEAVAAYDEVLGLEEQHRSPYLAHTLASRAVLALDAKQWPEAVALESRSIVTFEAASGKETPDLFKPLAGMGQAKLGQGKPTEARTYLERALAIAAKSQLGANDVDPVKKLLAQAR